MLARAGARVIEDARALAQRAFGLVGELPEGTLNLAGLALRSWLQRLFGSP